MKIGFQVDVDSPGEIADAIAVLTAFGIALHPDKPAEGKKVATAAEKKKAVLERHGRSSAAKVAAVKAEAETEEDMGSAIDREEVRAALKAHAAIEGKDAAIAILKDHGSPSIGELAEEHFAAVIEACE